MLRHHQSPNGELATRRSVEPYASVLTIQAVFRDTTRAAASGLSPFENVEEATLQHFHIRWSGANLDWEVFPTQQEAEREAKELMHPGEMFTVEQFDGDCPKCREMRPRVEAEPDTSPRRVR